jgi:hypothetical protein
MYKPWWKRRPGRWILWLWWQRTVNLYQDIRAVAFGNCNACPYGKSNPYGGGGYPHWRCDLARGHTGPHRFLNYTWEPGGTVEYAPIERPWSNAIDVAERRYMVRTLSQQRAYDRALRASREEGYRYGCGRG